MIRTLFRRRGVSLLLTVIAASSTALPLASPAGAASVTGTMVVSWAGATGDGPVPGVTAAWAFGFAPMSFSSGSYPATLTNVDQSFTTPCDPDDGAAGATTTTTHAIADAVAGVEYAALLDLRRRRGSMTFRPARGNNGVATQDADQECAAPNDFGNGHHLSDVPVSALFGGDVDTAPAWPLHQDVSGAWIASGTRTVSPGNAPAGTAPQVQHLQARLVGAPAALKAQCRMPTPYELRTIASLRAATSYLASAGFTKPSFFVLHSRFVPKGHYFINEQVNTGDRYRQCGSHLVTLVRSSGR